MIKIYTDAVIIKMKQMEKKKKEKKDTILQAAQEAFHSAGYTGTSIDTIAEKAKVTKQTVYRYFESKELLFKAVMEAQRSQQSNMEFVETLEQENTKEALENFALGFIQWHLSKEHLANIRLLISEGPMIPEITRWFYARGPQSTEALLAGFLKKRLHIEEIGRASCRERVYVLV